MDLDHDFFWARKLSEKKGLPKIGRLFFPRFYVKTSAQMQTRVKLLGGCRCTPYSNYWGAYIQIIEGDKSRHPPPGFEHPLLKPTPLYVPKMHGSIIRTHRRTLKNASMKRGIQRLRTIGLQ